MFNEINRKYMVLIENKKKLENDLKEQKVLEESIKKKNNEMINNLNETLEKNKKLQEEIVKNKNNDNPKKKPKNKKK